jgi:hypothetical protein
MTSEREAQVIRDMKSGWMPKNPCNCENPNRERDECDMYCLGQKLAYQTSVKAQKKLLKYLIKRSEFYSMPDTYLPGVPAYDLEEMLKVLEQV